MSGGNSTLLCYTDGSKKNGELGAAVHIIGDENLVKEESYHLDSKSFPNNLIFWVIFEKDKIHSMVRAVGSIINGTID